jgi:acetyl esterase
MRLDPEFEPLHGFPDPDLTKLPEIRAFMTAMQGTMPRRQMQAGAFEDRAIPGGGGEIGIRIYTPAGPPKGALLYLHGGGFVLGNLDSEHDICVAYAEGAGCVVVSVDYRLAPEHPFPAAHDDARAALRWLFDHAGELGVDPTCIAVGGGSAGACLAAGLALRARDEGSPALRFALLVQPVIDHLSRSVSARTFNDTPFLKADHLQPVWQIYLGQTPPAGKDLAYAAPFAATDLADFPHSCIIIGNVDPSRDEALAFATRLIDAGAEVELHLAPGIPHGFDLVEDAPVTRRLLDIRIAALSRAFSTPAERP